MAKVRNAQIKIFDSITELGEKNRMRKTLSNALVCVLYDNKELIQEESAVAFITQNIASESCLIVFIYTSIDKRTKFYKAHQDEIVDFPHLKPEILVKYVQREVALSDKSALRLIGACECDYSRILLEIDKVKAVGLHAADVTRSTEYDADKALDYLFRHGLIYQPPKDAVFDFVDAVLRNKRKLAYELLDESYASGEATLVLLSNLFNSARQLFQVQACGSGKDMSAITGLTPFQIKLASGRKGYSSNERLLELMRLTREAETGIKTGGIEDTVAVEYVLAQYWA